MPGVHKKVQLLHRGRHRAKRPKTFKSVAKAKAHADASGNKKYEVVQMNYGLSRKFKIVSK